MLKGDGIKVAQKGKDPQHSGNAKGLSHRHHRRFFQYQFADIQAVSPSFPMAPF